MCREQSPSGGLWRLKVPNSFLVNVYTHSFVDGIPTGTAGAGGKLQ